MNCQRCMMITRVTEWFLWKHCLSLPVAFPLAAKRSPVMNWQEKDLKSLSYHGVRKKKKKSHSKICLSHASAFSQHFGSLMNLTFITVYLYWFILMYVRMQAFVYTCKPLHGEHSGAYCWTCLLISKSFHLPFYTDAGDRA